MKFYFAKIDFISKFSSSFSSFSSLPDKAGKSARTLPKTPVQLINLFLSLHFFLSFRLRNGIPSIASNYSIRSHIGDLRNGNAMESCPLDGEDGVDSSNWVGFFLLNGCRWSCQFSPIWGYWSFPRWLIRFLQFTHSWSSGTLDELCCTIYPTFGRSIYAILGYYY